MSIKAPFNDSIISNFEHYQIVGYLHPYTCGNCSGVSLKIKSSCLYCPECDYTQSSINHLPTIEEIDKMNPKQFFKI